MTNLTAYIDQYGYLVLFGALLLELIAVPLPGEVLMSYSGFLVFQGHLNWLLSILVAGIGACMGMTISYWIGFKLGTPFFDKYGHRFHLGPDKIEKTSQWFSKHGNKVLIIAYFIPGVRHITGYFSGITRITFRRFALFAYSGAFLWVTVFITLGKILGPQWEQFHQSIKKYLLIGGIIAAVLLIALYIYKKYKYEMEGGAVKLLNFTLNVFHSRKKVGLLLGITAASTLGLIILMIGMVQDFLGGEFSDFNEIVSVLVPLTFNKSWEGTMNLFFLMGSRKFLWVLIIFGVSWIFWRGRDRLLEWLSLGLVAGGGELYEETLRIVFHKLSPISRSLIDQLLYTFPSEQMLMTIVIYGFIVFIVVRHAKRIWVHTMVPITVLVLLTFIAVSRVYFNVEIPSDVAAGYVFGGVWLGINILLLEIFKLLKSIETGLLKPSNS